MLSMQHSSEQSRFAISPIAKTTGSNQANLQRIEHTAVAEMFTTDAGVLSR
jgi:hypothetical protein